MTALLGVTPFKGIDPAELDRIEATSRSVEPRDGSSIFAEGDVADAVYAISAAPATSASAHSTATARAS